MASGNLAMGITAPVFDICGLRARRIKSPDIALLVIPPHARYGRDDRRVPGSQAAIALSVSQRSVL
jgi:hypothetical protein